MEPKWVRAKGERACDVTNCTATIRAGAVYLRMLGMVETADGEVERPIRWCEDCANEFGYRRKSAAT